MGRLFAFVMLLALGAGAARAQDADWEACKSYDAEKSAAACSRIIAAGKEPPAALAAAHNNRAIANQALKRQQQALSDYGEALRLDPGSARAYYNRALVLSALGRPEAARADLDAAIHLDAGYAKAYARRGLDRLDDEPAGAVDDLARALELEPKLELDSAPKAPLGYGEKAPPSLAKRLVEAGDKLAGEGSDQARAKKAFAVALRLEPGNAEARQRALGVPAPPAVPVAPPGKAGTPPAKGTTKAQPAATPAAPAARPPAGSAAVAPAAPAAPAVTAAKAGPGATAPPPAPAATAAAAAATSPAGTQGVATDGMLHYAGKAAEGNDIARASVASIEECRARCKSTAGCGAFSFDAWNKLCLLKSTAACLRRDPRYTTAVTASVTVRFGTEATVIDRRRQRAYPDAGYRNETADTFEACGELCQKDDRCEGFNYRAATRACSLIARPGEYASDPQSEVGIRSQRASPACRG